MADLVQFTAPEPVLLDYAGAEGLLDILTNLSGAAVEGKRLWTVSDEGRTIELMLRDGDGYKLAEQIQLDDLFPDLPKGEADLESICCADGRLWVAGSHTRVRRPAEGVPRPKLRDRPSRHLLGSLTAAGEARALPQTGRGALRPALAKDPFLRPFLELPTKENGLDIEGQAVLGNRLFLGLRGPLIDNHAIVLEVPLSSTGRVRLAGLRRHFLWLGGLGVRDLARDGDRLLVVAGPVTAAAGPFTLHDWTPGRGGGVDFPESIARWPEAAERPEGVCRLDRGGRRGLLVLYDAPDGDRIDGASYRADWFALGGLQPLPGSR